MPGENCMTNMHTTYEHQLIIINHFQNKPNFEDTMYAFLLLLFNNEVHSEAKKAKSRKLKTFYSSCNHKHLHLGKTP